MNKYQNERGISVIRKKKKRKIQKAKGGAYFIWLAIAIILSAVLFAMELC